MGRWNRAWFLFLFASAGFAADPLPPWCLKLYEELAAKAALYNPARDRGRFSLELSLEPHVKAAFDQTLEAWKAQGKPPPLENYPPEGLIAFAKAWLKSLENLARESRRIGSVERPYPTRDVKKTRAISLNEGGRTKYFVAATDDAALNHRYLAGALSQAMGLETVPPGEFVYLNGRLGYLVERAPGKGFVSGNQGDRVLQMMRDGKIREDSFADGQAFEFLINNGDAHAGDLRVDSEGKLRMFDHDSAFGYTMLSAQRHTRHSTALGWTLPERYSRRFVDGIRAMTEAKVHALADAYLA